MLARVDDHKAVPEPVLELVSTLSYGPAANLSVELCHSRWHPLVDVGDDPKIGMPLLCRTATCAPVLLCILRVSKPHKSFCNQQRAHYRRQHPELVPLVRRSGFGRLRRQKRLDLFQ